MIESVSQERKRGRANYTVIDMMCTACLMIPLSQQRGGQGRGGGGDKGRDTVVFDMDMSCRRR